MTGLGKHVLLKSSSLSFNDLSPSKILQHMSIEYPDRKATGTVVKNTIPYIWSKLDNIGYEWNIVDKVMKCNLYYFKYCKL